MASRRAFSATSRSWISTAEYPSKCGIVKKASGCAARTASFSPRSSTRTARIGPSGGVWSPNRLMSALLNGRSHANALPATNQVRFPCRSPTVTSGRPAAIRAASSTVAIGQRYAAGRPGLKGCPPVTREGGMTTALLIMDVQQGIVERFASDESYLDGLATAITAARAAGVMVGYVTIAFRPGYPEVSDRNKSFGAIAGSGRFTDGDPGTQIPAAVAPAPGEAVVIKRRVSAFTGSDLEVLLRARRIEHLVLAG